jgi:small subunit ribosomal protein S17e
MGIKPTYVKSISEELLAKYGDRFTHTFEENKQSVEVLMTGHSKSVRNRIAGSITRRMNSKKKHK